MKAALIGYTGFVGGTLSRQNTFNEVFNSANIHEIKGKEYDLLICAGAPGKKWLANQYPDDDRASIQNLIDNLLLVKASQFVLISTVDVYPNSLHAHEKTVIDVNLQNPYGKSRYLLEQFIQDRFVNSHIIRLPALFGHGLKKNFVFDLINNNIIDATHPDSSFQFYNMDNLMNDINKVMKSGEKLVNFATEPLRAGDIAMEALGFSWIPRDGISPVHYDFYTLHAHIFSKKGNYIYDRSELFPQLIDFIRSGKK